MPNWNYNFVVIDAPVKEVKKFFVQEGDHDFRFNMNKLYPDIFQDNDLNGEKNWGYDWASENTGSKWFPHVDINEGAGSHESVLVYETAWAPNNLLLEKLHKLTGWTIKNEYEEP